MSSSKRGANAAARPRCTCGQFVHDGRPCGQPGPKPRPLAVRIAEKTAQPDKNGCRRWLGELSKNGYPVISKRYVCRLLLGLKRGDGLVARHTCDNSWCANLDHLVRGSQAQNMDDMVTRSRSQYGRRHWNVRLTTEQVTAIRADPRPSPEIAADYNVTARHIRKIQAGDRWVKGPDDAPLLGGEKVYSVQARSADHGC